MQFEFAAISAKVCSLFFTFWVKSLQNAESVAMEGRERVGGGNFKGNLILRLDKDPAWRESEVSFGNLSLSRKNSQGWSLEDPISYITFKVGAVREEL